MHQRSGMTLVEVVIAMSLFALVMVAVMQSAASVVQYGALGEAEDDLNRAGTSLVRMISDDLYSSGWNVPSASALPTAWADDRTALYYPYAISQGGSLGIASAHHSQATAVYDWLSKQDRLRQEQLKAALPGSSTDLTAAYADPLTAANRVAYMKSYFARSVSLIFVKSMIDEWTATPTAKVAGRNEFRRIDFKSTGANPTSDAQWAAVGNHNVLGVLYASPWTFDDLGAAVLRTPPAAGGAAGNVAPPAGGAAAATPYGIPITTGRLNLTTLALQPMWEGVSAPQYNATILPGQADLIPREYIYCVVPSPLGVGRLVRAHLELDPASTGRAASAALNTPNGIIVGDVLSRGVYPSPAPSLPVKMVVDSILSEHVTRVVFETFRTQDPTASGLLAINQVRMRLYLARVLEVNGGGVVKATFDTIITMRANNTPTQVVADSTLVKGVTGGFKF
jgi:prepilin-type N-terminal cleavage/methylation domain-containing protein